MGSDSNRGPRLTCTNEGGEYPCHSKPESEILGLVVNPDWARTWSTREEAEAAVQRANVAGVAVAYVVEI